jgi:hypothetical protein
VILLDAGSAVLRPMGANLGNKAQARPQKMGVELQLGARVVDVDRDGLTVRDSDAHMAIPTSFTDQLRLSGKGRPLRQAIIHKLGLFAFQQFSASCLTLFQLLDVDF